MCLSDYILQRTSQVYDNKIDSCPLPDPSDNAIQDKFKDNTDDAVVSTLIFSSSIEPV